MATSRRPAALVDLTELPFRMTNSPYDAIDVGVLGHRGGFLGPMIETVGTARRGYFAEHAWLQDITFGAWTAALSASGSVHDLLECGHAGVANSRLTSCLPAGTSRKSAVL